MSEPTSTVTTTRRWLPRFATREVEIHEHDHDDHHHEGEWKLQLVASLICAALGLIAALVAGPQLALPLFLAAYLAGGWFTAQETWEKLNEGEIDVHFLMLAVAVGAAAIGKWGEGTTLLFLFSFSGALEHFAMERTQKEIRSLFDSAPKTAIVLAPDGTERTVPVDELTVGLRLSVKPGTMFPVDGEVAKGETTADESNLTGEATPVEKRPGDAVLAGTLNQGGVVEVVVSRPAQESALQKIIRLIQTAQRNKAPAQRFTDKFGSRYTLGILALTLVMFFVWWLALGHAPFVSTAAQPSAFYHAMTLLVVASPCALVLSIPSAILAAIAWGARRGILFRGGAAVEELGEINLVAMDKTGTLTSGDLRVEKVESFPAGQEEKVLRLAYSLDRHSTHPLARAIVRHAKRLGVEAEEITDFQQTPGMGILARVGSREVRLGRRVWLEDSTRATCAAVLMPERMGVSEVWLSAGELIGRVLLRDDIRPESRGLIEALHKRGLKTVVLTGDRQGSADHLKTELGLDDVRGELKPDQKLAIIEGFRSEGIKAAMVGDGVNDAPSLAAAHVGVAMGARGSDAALEQAEVVLMNDRLENFLAAYELSRRARHIIRQNLTISLGVIVVLVVSALFEKIPLTIGVIGHEGSTLIVVLNSLRLLFMKTET